jgi:hypothetical protein
MAVQSATQLAATTVTGTWTVQDGCIFIDVISPAV